MSGSNTGFTISAALVDNVSKQSAAISKTLQELKKSAEAVSKSSTTAFDGAKITRAAEGMRTFGDQSLGAARAVERMVPGMQLLTAAGSLAGIAALTRGWADAGNAIGKTANLLQAPIETVSALRGAARLAGSSADAMDQSLQGLNDTLSAAHWHREGAPIALLNQLGIGFDGAAGKARTAADALGDVAEAVTARNNDPDAQKRLLEKLGMSSDLIPLLNKGRKGLEDFRRQAEGTGGVMTGQMAENAKKMKTSWEELTLAVEGSGNRIIDSWSGTVTSVLKSSAKWIENNKKAADSIGEIGTAVMALSLLKPAAWVMKLLGLGALVPSGTTAAAAAAGVTAPASTGADITTGGGLVAGPAQWLTDWLSNHFGFRPPGGGAQGGGGGGGGRSGGPQIGPRAFRALDNGTVTGHASSLIAELEGYRPNAYWDTNAYRVGYGSDTITDPKTGAVSPVTASTHGVSREAAEADLNRRVANEFMPKAAEAIGADAWNRLTPGEKAAITSVAYNYGHVPNGLVIAARTGDATAISRAIGGLRGDNQGINADRRAREAQVALEPAPPPAAPAAPTGSVHVTVDVRHNGSQAAANASAAGIATTAPPRVESAMAGVY